MTGAVARWSAAHTRLGAKVRIIHDGGTPPAERQGVEWIAHPHRGRASRRVPVGLEDVLRDTDVLVLHSAWTSHGIRAARAAVRAGTPYILEPRGAYDPSIVRRRAWTKRLWWMLYEKRLVHRAAAVHAFFSDELPALTALGYAGPTIVAPNGTVDLPDLQWRGGGGYLLFLGRYDVVHKGLDLLLGGLAQCPAHLRPRLRLHGSDHYGGGGKLAVLKMVHELELEEFVDVLSHVSGPDKLRVLAECDGFVYPSRWDACPNSVLEAAGAGVPCLVTPYPLGAHLANNGAAMLADCSVDGLAEGLVAMGDADTRRSLGARAAEVVARDFAWDTVAAAWLAQAEEILGRTR